MQRHHKRFREPDGTGLSSLQSCIRTNDIDLAGDGSHLTSFQMLGNFSFRGIPYQKSIEMWHEIITSLNIPVSTVHVHPKSSHHSWWRNLGYSIIDDIDCQWSDGDIGGYCCELYCGNLEIGNLVNTLEHSTDVGFGWERIVQILEQKSRVDETSLFRQDLDYLSRDHVRTLEVMWDNGIRPESKGRGYICRKLLRKLVGYDLKGVVFQDWLDYETDLREKKLYKAKKYRDKYKDMTDEWWWDSFGVTAEERRLL